MGCKLRWQVVRTAQYGCNCRNAGGNGGCGEFDIVEAVIGVDHSDMLFTTVYDFKGTGAPGHGKYFLRPSVSTRPRPSAVTPLLECRGHPLVAEPYYSCSHDAFWLLG